MSKNSPLNFGMMGGSMSSLFSGAYGNLSDEDLRSKYDSYSSLNPMMSSNSMIQSQQAAMQAEIQRRQSLGNFGMPQESQAAAGLAGSVNQGLGGIAGSINQGLGGAAAAENNATEAAQTQYQLPAYLGNPYADGQSNTTTAGMAVGDAPVATASNFNPETQFAAKNIFGRQKFRRKPLINL